MYLIMYLLMYLHIWLNVPIRHPHKYGVDIRDPSFSQRLNLDNGKTYLFTKIKKKFIFTKAKFK